MLTNPNTFVSRLFKARYFPQGSILEAPAGNNPSFVWRSILAGKELIVRGLAKRIGDDVKRIIRTPVNLNQADEWYWRYETRGDYSVRSGYRLLSEQPSETSNFKSWRKLWNLRVAPKIWNLLWRCIKEILPVRANLRRRRMEVQSECPLNELVWNNKPFNGDMVWRQAQGLINSWDEAHAAKERTLVKSSSELNWVSTGLRCYVDAALFEDHGLARYGAIMLNNANKLVAACAGTRTCSIDPYLAEMWAIKEALSWIKGHDWGPVTILTDCMNACNSLNCQMDDRSYAGIITKECKSIMVTLNHVSIRYVARTLNTQAHDLAKSTLMYRDSRYWRFKPPICTFEFPIT
nr:uncharacterized protein LOC109160490 [Ipomoea batatas]